LLLGSAPGWNSAAGFRSPLCHAVATPPILKKQKPAEFGFLEMGSLQPWFCLAYF